MTLLTIGETALRFSPPDGGRFETAREVTLRADGTASSVAATASRLGADAVWLSKLPDTPLGRRVVAELHEYGLETDVVWADPDDGRQGLAFYEDATPPREDRLLQDRDDAAMATVAPGELPMDRVQDADVVFAAGSTASLSTAAADTVGALLRAAPGLCALDLDYHPGLWDAEAAKATLTGLFDAVDLLFASEAQLTTVLDRSGSARELAHSVATDYGLGGVVVTRSERGVVAFEDNVVHEQEAIETEAVDSTGQHAALVGAVLQQLLQDTPIDDALVHGVAAAALARTMPGPLTPIEPAEVTRLVDESAARGR